jgi:hypothetical protein
MKNSKTLIISLSLFFIPALMLINTSMVRAECDDLPDVDKAKCGEHLLRMERDNIFSESESESGDPNTKMIILSYKEILERIPNQKEIDYWKQRISQTGETYDQILEVHRAWKNSGGK